MRGDWMDEARRFEDIDKAALATIRLRCDGCDFPTPDPASMIRCEDDSTYIDDKGFVYCARHGKRPSYSRCRKLKPAELSRLQSGGTLPHY